MSPATKNIGLQLIKHALIGQAQKGQNFAGSPVSITVALNMLTAGMKGDSSHKFPKSLGYESIHELNDKSSKLMALASSKTGKPIVSMQANGVWVNQRLTVKASFEEGLQRVYGTEPKYRDFIYKADEVTKEVSSWIREQTRGLIKNMSASVTPPMLMVLVNALYFKGEWVSPFLPFNTEEDDFYLLTGESIQVPFMSSYHNYYSCGSFEGFKVLNLHYKSKGDPRKSFSMHLFLPNERNGLLKLINQLGSDMRFLINQNFNLRRTLVGELKIPKFKFLSGLNFTEAMNDSGVPLPSLSGMEIIEGDSCGHDDKLEVFHRVCIDVNEKGTEAAAVTKILCGCSLNVPTPEIENFIADHPFLFMIKEDISNAPFFIGAVLNPLLKDCIN